MAEITEEQRPGVEPGAVTDRLQATDNSELDRHRTESNDEASQRHIRGSSILLAGRFVSLGLNFGVQVLTVRYLSKSNYGAFAYALSVVSMGASVSLFGLDKAISRFIPIYHERDQLRRMLGTVVMTAGTIIAIGLALIFAVVGFQSVLGARVVNDPQALSLLVILVALAPMHALDSWFQGMFAVFAKPQAIFFRRHVLGPGLKLLAVVLVILSGAGVYTLAWGYLAGGVLGLLAYVTMLWRLLKDNNLLQMSLLRNLEMPFREVFSFSSPLLTSDVVNILRSSMVIVLLEYFSTTTQIAEFRAVLPVAGLNLVVMQSFKYLFTPLAARLFTREDKKGMNDLYWRTAIWIAVFSFPIFAVTFSLARPLTVLLFGERYASSGAILAILALANYFNSALGLNSYTLRVYGKVRYIVSIDIASGLLSLVASLLLIPTYGAIGAAIGVASTLIIYNLLNHLGLLLGTDIQLFQWRYLRVYAAIVAGAVLLWLANGFLETQMPGFVSSQDVARYLTLGISLAFAALVSVLLLRLNRGVMDVDKMFPELKRIPMVGRLVGM